MIVTAPQCRIREMSIVPSSIHYISSVQTRDHWPWWILHYLSPYLIIISLQNLLIECAQGIVYAIVEYVEKQGSHGESEVNIDNYTQFTLAKIIGIVIKKNWIPIRIEFTLHYCCDCVAIAFDICMLLRNWKPRQLVLWR